MTTYYVGLSVTGHDPAFAIVDAQGRLLFAEATERHLQSKRAWGAAADEYDHIGPAIARYCPDATRIVAALSWARAKPEVEAPDCAGERVPGIIDPLQAYWLRQHQQRAFEYAGMNLPLVAPGIPIDRRAFDHHACHAAFAAGSSPFDAAKVVVIDGEGDVGAVSVYDMQDRTLARKWRSWGHGSLGYLYGFVTDGCGFDWRLGEEWKVMGLAAFGTVREAIVEALMRLVTLDRGRPRAAEPASWRGVLDELAPFRRTSGEDVMRGADLAASGQAVYEALATGVLQAAGLGEGDNLVLGGGCALNSAFNGTLRDSFGLAGVHVPCAPADDGNAAGAALLAWQGDNGRAPLPQGWNSPFLGSTPDRDTLQKAIASGGLGSVTQLRESETAPIVELLAGGAILGVMRGRAEYGPRALGNRSILADPRAPDMKDRLNREVKGREPYRPFAPVTRIEEAEDWFDAPVPSPYMSFTARWRPGRAERVPAVVHADGTGRHQTVTEEVNPWLAALVRDFGAATDVPVVLNTSLNVMGKPIAHSIHDAMTILATTGLDALLVEDVLIEKRPG
jgi:carbamoyltransferase